MHQLINTLSLAVVISAFVLSRVSFAVAVRFLTLRKEASGNPHLFFSKSRFKSIDELTDRSKFFFRLSKNLFKVAFFFGLLGLVNSLV